MHRFATITKNASNPAYKGARLGVDRLARERNVEIIHRSPATPDDVDQQIGLLEEMIDLRPDAVLLAPAHLHALGDVLAKLEAEDIPIIMFVSKTAVGSPRCFIGSNDYQMTFDVGVEVCKQLAPGSKVVILDGNPLGINYHDRGSGFRDAVRTFDGIEVVDREDGFFLKEPGKQAMLNIMDRTPHFDAVLAVNDFMVEGAIEALEGKGLRPLIGSVNATPAGAALVKSGKMLTTAAFNAMAMGCMALEAAIRLMEGRALPREVILPTELVTQENAEEWMLDYDRRPLPRWNDYVT